MARIGLLTAAGRSPVRDEILAAMKDVQADGLPVARTSPPTTPTSTCASSPPSSAASSHDEDASPRSC